MIELAGKKIIVTFLMHLGDLVLTTPFLHALRQAAPGADITYLVDENGVIEKVWPKVKPDTNAQEILDYLQGKGQEG